MRKHQGCIIEPLQPRQLFAVGPDIGVEYGYISMDPKTGRMNQSAIIHNYGNAATGLYKIRWFLSRDQEVNNGDDITLLEATLSDNPTPGHFITRRDPTFIGYTVPNGAYFVGFAADVDGQVAEGDELNNYAFTNFPVIFIQSENVIGKGTASEDVISLTRDSLVVPEPKMYLVVNGVVTTYNPYRIGSINIDGAEGNDRITIADDINNGAYVLGGPGDDLIVGGAGNDTLTGASGRDTLTGAGGNDRLNGGKGNDRIMGGGGKDRLYGGDGIDYLDGGSSNDHLDGGAGRDIMYGQGGNDIFAAQDREVDLLFGGSGTDTADTDPIDIVQSVSTS